MDDCVIDQSALNAGEFRHLGYRGAPVEPLCLALSDRRDP
jgi:hypothetical protein